MSGIHQQIDELLKKLLDHSVDGTWTSGFGLTDYNPGTDFPVCRQAVEALVEIGPAIIPRVLELLAGSANEQTYFLAEIAGRLDLREAIPRLEEFILRGTEVSRRVNYDQYIEYRVYEPALAALLQMDPHRARLALQDVASRREWTSAWAKEMLQRTD